MKLIKHNTAEEITAAFWRFNENEMTIEDFLKSDGEGYTETGEIVSFSGADELAAMKENGFWGYCDPKTKTVNVWIGENARPEEIIYFLAHEIGHASGVPVEGDSVEAEVAEEERANEYGASRTASIYLAQRTNAVVFATRRLTFETGVGRAPNTRKLNKKVAARALTRRRNCWLPPLFSPRLHLKKSAF